MNYLNATVERHDGDSPAATRRSFNVATISRTGHTGESETKGGVTAVKRSGPRQATVHFNDGTHWTVSAPDRKAGGCGCG